MSRILFLLLTAAVVYLLLKPRQGRPPAAPRAGRADGTRPAEDMVRCVECGVHLPRSEAIMAGRKFYCSHAHRLAYRVPPQDHDAA